MPYEPLPGRPLVALAASLAAVLVVYVVRPVSGADGSLLASFVPLVAAARFGGWREALCVVWSATLAVQFSPPPEIPIDVPGVPENRWIPAAVWGLVYAAAGTAGCLTLRRQVESDVERARGAIRDRFRALIGSNFLPMFMGTIDGRVTEANAAWNRVAGVPSRERGFVQTNSRHRR
jgi:PAS domain-containing protein